MAGSLPTNLQELLKSTSRSFYLSVRVLPRPVRAQIGLAYLLARATDSVADSSSLPAEARTIALRQLSQAVREPSATECDLDAVVAAQKIEAEAVLLERFPELIAVLRSFSAEDQKLIAAVIETISSGQELDLVRFPNSSPGVIAALATDAELEDYTYRVAGCVGEFWTRLCSAHLLRADAAPIPGLIERGVSFGKGLQLVNILRDLPVDLREGRCYIPAGELAEHGLTPPQLLEISSMEVFRPLYDRYLDRAEKYLRDGWDYVTLLPPNQVRWRLSCAWPALIGIRTLRQLRRANVLDPDSRVKVSRAEVRSIFFWSIVKYPHKHWWNSLFDEAARAA